jgi:excisionase family DNA binding protein
MVQGFYTLEEAARILGMSAEDLNRMAQKREIRAFADRGTWRFRTQDIEELGRKREAEGAAADVAPPEPAAEPAKPKSKSKAKTVATSPAQPAEPTAGDDDIFGFSLSTDDPVEIGQEMPGDSGKVSKSTTSHKSGPKSGLKPDDSAIPLAAEGDDFNLDLSDSGTVAPPSDVKKTSEVQLGESKSAIKRRTVSPGERQDTGVKLVPEGPDSDVRLDFDSSVGLKPDDSMVSVGELLPKSPGDSAPRLEGAAPPGAAQEDFNLESVPTEEMIDLDAELRKADEASMKMKPLSEVKPSSKVKSQTKPPELATTSPFELSESELDMGEPTGDDSSASSLDSGSDFDLVVPTEETGSDSLELPSEDEEVELGTLPPSGELTSRAGQSGINLRDPADSGISLERESPQADEIDFELSLDPDNSLTGPKTGPKGGSDIDSDSEFELTLDEEGGDLSADSQTAEVEASSEEKDIFETDFDLPALEEESGSQAVALDEGDTDLESSDFDLALDEGDAAGVSEDSGSEVIALGEEEPAEGPATIARKRSAVHAAAVEEESGSEFDLLTSDDIEEIDRRPARRDEEGEEALEPVGAVGPTVAEADWGVLPTMLMLPCVIVMILVVLMSYELLHGMWGYHQSHKPSSILVTPLARLFTDNLPPD